MPNLLSQPDALLILKEALLRLKERSPKFFRVLQNVNYGITLIGVIPIVLTWLGIILPPEWAVVLLKVVSIAGAWGVLMAKLSVSQPTKEVLPFTTKKNIEQIVERNEKIIEEQSKIP